MRFRSDPAAVRGSIAPIVTPFTATGEVDHDGIRTLVRWQLEAGSHGISIGGSTGEPSAQTVPERIAAMQVVAEEIGDRVPFVPGTGSAKLDETLELTQAAIDLGADIALVITPYYSRPTQEGLFQWYSAVATTFPSMPIVVYTVPIRTAVDVAPETVARLRKAHANIVGIKETTRDFEHVSYVLVMSVNPGFSGQAFIPHSIDKVAAARELLTSERSAAVIEVDGGVDETNAAALVRAGASILVAGAAVFGAADPAEATRALRRSAGVAA